MSLDWNISKVKNKEKVCYIGDDPKTKALNPVTEALIWRSMSLDIGLIEEGNVPEWLFRTRYYSRLFGKPLTKSVKKCRLCSGESGVFGVWACACPHPEFEDCPKAFDFTLEEIKAHVGLYTNVRTLSRAGFLKKMQKQITYEIEREMRNQQ